MSRSPVEIVYETSDSRYSNAESVIPIIFNRYRYARWINSNSTDEMSIIKIEAYILIKDPH